MYIKVESAGTIYSNFEDLDSWLRQSMFSFFGVETPDSYQNYRYPRGIEIESVKHFALVFAICTCFFDILILNCYLFYLWFMKIVMILKIHVFCRLAPSSSWQRSSVCSALPSSLPCWRLPAVTSSGKMCPYWLGDIEWGSLANVGLAEGRAHLVYVWYRGHIGQMRQKWPQIDILCFSMPIITLNQTQKLFSQKSNLQIMVLEIFFEKFQKIWNLLLTHVRHPCFTLFTARNLKTDEKMNKTFTFGAKTCSFAHFQALREGHVCTDLQSICSESVWYRTKLHYKPKSITEHDRTQICNSKWNQSCQTFTKPMKLSNIRAVKCGHLLSIFTMRGVKLPFVTATLAWEAMASWPLPVKSGHFTPLIVEMPLVSTSNFFCLQRT